MISYYNTTFKPIVMKKIFTLLFIAVLFCFNANAQTNDLLKYIPQKAGIIIDIDGGSLSQKLSRQDLMELKFLDSLFKKAKAESKEKFVDPSESGINNHDHFYIIFDMKKDDENGSFTIFGKVSDESKLSQALEKVHDKEVTRKTSGANKMMISENFLFGWNNSVFVAHASMPFKKWSGPETELTPAEKKKQLALSEKKCLELLTPKGPTNFAKNFESFVQTKGDFKIWIDNKSMTGDLKKDGPFAMFRMNNLLQADHKAIIVNFEKGKIVSNSYTYYDESTLSSVQNIYAEKLNADLFKKIPAGNLFGLYAMSFKPDGVKNFVESSGLLNKFKKDEKEAESDPLIKQKKPDFDPMIILDNLKGDIIMAVTFADQVYDDEGESKNPFSNFNILLAATIKDEMKVKKLIDSLTTAIEEKTEKREKEKIDTLEDGGITKHSNFFSDIKPSMKVENGTFYLTISPAKSGEMKLTSTNKYDQLYNEYGQRPTLMIFDIKTFMSMMMGLTKKMPQVEGQSEIFSIFEVFDKMVISGGKFENGAMITTQEVKFSSADENSLKQMMKMFDLAFSTLSNLKSKGTVKDIETKEN